MQESKEVTQLGAGLQGHLFAYTKPFLPSYLHKARKPQLLISSLLFSSHVPTPVLMAFRWPSDLLIFTDLSLGYSDSSKRRRQGLNGYLIQCISILFFIRGKDSESDRTEKLFSPTGVMQFLFKLRYLRCHAAVPINMPWNVEWAQVVYLILFLCL